MAKITHHLVIVLAALGMGLHFNAARAKELPFEQPPFLGTAPAVAPQAAVQARCDLQASFVRNGSIVSVELDFVRAHFTIENPGEGKEDQVELRSYGGCKSGPAVFVSPGDTMRVDLRNKTDVDDHTCPTSGSPPPGHLAS
jgi:hypothetical protein